VATGIVRRIDELGRVVIPSETRAMLGLPLGAPLEFFLDEDRIVLKAYRPGCLFCDGLDDVADFRGRLVCRTCVAEVREMVGGANEPSVLMGWALDAREA
jgi:transcriptional pleiotropic regulator of transition state genes